jgi:hypothetical protein
LLVVVLELVMELILLQVVRVVEELLEEVLELLQLVEVVLRIPALLAEEVVVPAS